MKCEIIGDAILYLGDCLDVAAELATNSIDAIVSDPPYGLEFMGKDWDRGVPGVHFWEAFSRVVKPGAHILAFGGTRTFHRQVVAIEAAYKAARLQPELFPKQETKQETKKHQKELF